MIFSISNIVELGKDENRKTIEHDIHLKAWDPIGDASPFCSLCYSTGFPKEKKKKSGLDCYI